MMLKSEFETIFFPNIIYSFSHACVDDYKYLLRIFRWWGVELFIICDNCKRESGDKAGRFAFHYGTKTYKNSTEQVFSSVHETRKVTTMHFDVGFIGKADAGVCLDCLNAERIKGPIELAKFLAFFGIAIGILFVGAEIFAINWTFSGDGLEPYFLYFLLPMFFFLVIFTVYKFRSVKVALNTGERIAINLKMPGIRNSLKIKDLHAFDSDEYSKLQFKS